MSTGRLGGVRKLPSGRYQARYRDPRGTLTKGGKPAMIKAPETFYTADDARTWLRGEQRLLEFDQWTPPSERETKRHANGMTVAALWGLFREHKLATRAWKTSTEETNASIYSTRIAPHLATHVVSELDRAAVDRWWTSVLAAHPGTHKRNYEARTLLRSMMGYAVDMHVLDANPVVGQVKKPKSAPMVIPTREQVEYIADHMAEHYRLPTLIMAWCGLRLGEVSALQRGDVVPASGEDDLWYLKVDRRVSRVRGQWDEGAPKTEHSIRRVPVPPHLVDFLTWHLHRFTGKGQDARLCTNRDGGTIVPQRFRRALASRAASAGCPGVRPHSLRHFAGTYYASMGATVKEIQGLLGHSTPAMALHYQHVAQGRPEALARLVSDSLGSVAGT